MNQPGTIGGNVPQSTKQRGFYIFDSIAGISDFNNRSTPWHNEGIIKKTERDSLFKNARRKKYLRLKKGGAKILKFSFKMFMPTQFTPT